MRSQHQHLSLQNSLITQRQVNGHLVTIEVGVERGTSQRVQLNSLTLDQFRLEGLDTQTVQRRGTVQQHRMTLHHILQDVPNHRFLTINDLLRRFHRLHDTALNELSDDERLIELSRHVLRQTALVHLQLRTHDDNGTCGIIDTLTQQVLTETSLLTLQAIREGLQRTVRIRLHRARFTRVIEQRIHSLLQHTLLITQDDLRSLNINQSFQTIITDNHPTIQIIQIGSSETATIQRNQRTKLRRDNGDHLHDHPLRLVTSARGTE